MNNNNQPTLFYIGIQSILKSWTALQLAVSHGFGGAHSNEKAQWFVGAIEQYFNENEQLETYELEDMMSEVMSSEFDTISEDGSCGEVAHEIWKLHRHWIRGEHDVIRERLSSLPCVNLGECIDDSSSLTDNGDEGTGSILQDMTLHSGNVTSQEMTTSEEAGPLPPKEDIVDEDGFTMVQTRSKRKGKR